VLLVLLLGALGAAEARAATIEAELSADSVAPGDQVVFTLTLTDAEGGRLEMPDFGELEAGSPSQSMQSSLAFSGGTPTVRSSRVYSWALRAPREGRFRIGPATLTLRGESYRTAPLDLSCDGSVTPTPHSPTPRAQRRNPFSPFQDDPFDALDEQLGRWGAGADPFRRAGEQDLFLRAIVDKSEAFLGEQITLTLYLFSQADVSGVQTVSFPKLDGFWAEDIEAPTQLTPEIKSIRGVPYRAYMLRKRALFPLRAGELSIDPVEAQVSLGLPLFWGAQPETVKRRSTPLSLQVKPLPAAGQPPAFEAGQVGDFKLTAVATPATVPLGQPVQLRVTVEGVGNVKSLRVPKPALPPGLKTFDPTVTDKVRHAGGKYGGTKTLEFVIIPERTGSFTLPGLELPHFVPAEGRYAVARTPDLALTVTGPLDGLAPGAATGAVGLPSATNVLGGGLRPVRLSGTVAAVATRPPWAEGWFWPLVAGPLVAWAGVALAGLAAGAMRGRDPEKLKVARAKGTAGRRLKEARAHLEARRPAEFHASVAKALLQFVTDKTGLGAQGLTRDELARELKGRGFAPADVDALASMLERCETARYSPGGQEPETMATLLEAARRLIDSMDGVKPTRAA
jgi:hypothetical protein